MAGGAGRRDVAVWAGILAAAVCTMLAGVALRGGGALETAAGWAQIVSLAIALPALVQVLRQLRRLPPVLAASAGTAEAVLADAVAAQWRAETVRRLLDDPDPMPVQWRVTGHDEVMDHADNITSGSLLTLSANSADIAVLVAQFRALRRPRLVVLGEGGTGKTTLAVQLVRELLATRAGDDPVPVLFTLAAWNPDVDESLRDWMADRLRRDYPELRRPELGRGVAQHLVSRGRVLPVLDGLDELPFCSRAALVTELNRSLCGTDQFILTSRTREFTATVRDVADVLTSALVVEPEPLSGQVAARYLRRCLPPAELPKWAEVLAALPGTPALSETTSTALGLWLVREVYVTPRRDPAPLLDFLDSRALRTHLYDHLIPALVAARPPSADPADLFLPRRAHDPARVRAWLTYLADLLAHDDPARPPDRDIAWWDIADKSGVLNARFASALAGILGMVMALTGGLLLGGVWFGVTGLVVGAGAGIGLWLALRQWTNERPGYADLRIRGHYGEFILEMVQTLRNLGPRIGAISTITVAVLFSAVISMPSPDMSLPLIPAEPLPPSFWPPSLIPAAPSSLPSAGPPPGDVPTVLPETPPAAELVQSDAQAMTSLSDVVSALAVVLAVVLASVVILVTALTLIRWSERPATNRGTNSPHRSWSADRALTGVRVAVLGLTSTLVASGIISVVAGSLTDPTTALEIGAAAVSLGVLGALFAVFMGHHHAWLAYHTATALLATRRRLPYRLLAFLDDAHRLGLLRGVGPVYQFRHADLQDHLTIRRKSKPTTFRR